MYAVVNRRKKIKKLEDEDGDIITKKYDEILINYEISGEKETWSG